MLREGRHFAALAPNIVVKVGMSEAGLEAIPGLAREGIKTNCTLIFSAAAAIRHSRHMMEAALAGAHIATVPLKVLRQMIHHPLTETGLRRFRADWDAVQKRSVGATEL